MTRDRMLKIMYAHGYRADMGDIADRILAVLESERQGEVVLGSVVYHERTDEVPLLEWFGRNYANFKKIYGKLGVLVFRPEESK